MKHYKVVIKIDTNKREWNERTIGKLIRQLLIALKPKEWDVAVGIEEVAKGGKSK